MHPPSPWGTSQRRGAIRKMGPHRIFGHYKVVGFFYRRGEWGGTWSLPGKDE